jgi:DNA primase
MIPDDVITQIRQAADIVAVIGQHVQLKKAGRNWKGLCPFHGEKTPSFNVSPDKGFFHCFGCQKHGDVFTFVMELEGKSFVEAAEQIGGRFGVAVPRVEESPELRRARGERVAMLDLNKVAAAFYREVLADPKRGAPGRAYLDQRGVSAETADRFQLGYAPADWGALADHLKARRCDLELAVRLGLVANRPRAGGYYDRNRDRLVCPVIVPGGEVVGFSSRVVGAAESPADGHDPPPKYINSPESTVYKKSKNLFGLAQAREAMAAQKRAVLVEGNFDVITLHQAGFCEVVAPLGTALTPEQIGVLKRLTERVVLLYDGDRAGYKATMHALQLCTEADVEVLIARRPGHARSGGAGPLSDGVDPDSLVASGGAAQLREAVDRAQGGVEFFVNEVWGKARANADARARALEDAARLIAKVTTQTKRDLFVGTLADGLGVETSVIRSAIARASADGSSGHGSGGWRAGEGRATERGMGWRAADGRPAERGAPAHPNAPDGAAAGQHPDAARPPAAPQIEEVEVIALLADHPSLVATAEADKAFWLLTDARLRDMYSAARERGKSLIELAPVQLPQPTAVIILSGKYADAKDPRAELLGQLRNLEHRKAELEQAEVQQGLVQARRRGDSHKARLLTQLAVAMRSGDQEAVTRLKESLASETSNGKQVD